MAAAMPKPQNQGLVRTRRTGPCPRTAPLSLSTSNAVSCAAGGADGRVRLWKAGADRDMALWQSLDDAGFGRVTAIAVSRDGRRIAAAGTGTGAITIYRVDQREPLRLVNPSSREAAVSLSFSDDGM